jgi:hypothetical protein
MALTLKTLLPEEYFGFLFIDSCKKGVEGGLFQMENGA